LAKKAILPMVIDEENIDENFYEMVESSFDYVNVKAGMPSNAKENKLKKCNVPTFVIAAGKDCLFPGKKVIERAEKTLPNIKTHLLQNQGHLCKLSTDVMNMIREFMWQFGNC
jgi:pimeloyl-ACP methyl ester carboxylesterase